MYGDSNLNYHVLRVVGSSSGWLCWVHKAPIRVWSRPLWSQPFVEPTTCGANHLEIQAFEKALVWTPDRSTSGKSTEIRPYNTRCSRKRHLFQVGSEQSPYLDPGFGRLSESRPISKAKHSFEKVSELACLVGKTFVHSVGVL